MRCVDLVIGYGENGRMEEWKTVSMGRGRGRISWMGLWV